MALLKAIGKESMAILSVEKNTGFHCRSDTAQIVINGQSRAQTLRTQFHTLWYRVRQRKGLRSVALGQRLRRLPTTSPPAQGRPAAKAHSGSGSRPSKRAGMRSADPRMPVTSTLLDQAHNTLDRKLFMMKGFHHPRGNQQAFL